MQKEWYVTCAVLGLFFFVGLAELIWFLERWIREFKTLLSSVGQKDFTNVYPALTSASREFDQAFTRLVTVYQDIRIEKELHYQFLQLLLENINIAVICFDGSGKITTANTRAKTLLGLSAVSPADASAVTAGDLFRCATATARSLQEPLSIMKGKEELQLAVTSTRFRIRNTDYLLVSLQDIRNELETRELDSWRKLIRVLTHEIMNSVTPISSLSEALFEMMNPKEGQPLSFSPENMEDLKSGLSIIKDRSKSLAVFMNVYRSLVKLPKPELSEIPLQEIFDTIRRLLGPELASRNITFTGDVRDPSLSVRADKGMLEQMLINLVLNAMEGITMAGTEPAAIICRGFRRDHTVIVEVQDNGKGIPEEIREEVFLPFFTTKEKGSGIGLSLTRQMMNLHKGTVTFRSLPGIKTVFRLSFPDTAKGE